MGAPCLPGGEGRGRHPQAQDLTTRTAESKKGKHPTKDSWADFSSPSALKLLVPLTLWARSSEPPSPMKGSIPPHPACREYRDLHPQDTTAIRPQCHLLTPHPKTVTTFQHSSALRIQREPALLTILSFLRTTAPGSCP